MGLSLYSSTRCAFHAGPPQLERSAVTVTRPVRLVSRFTTANRKWCWRPTTQPIARSGFVKWRRPTRTAWPWNGLSCSDSDPVNPSQIITFINNYLGWYPFSLWTNYRARLIKCRGRVKVLSYEFLYFIT